MYGDSNDLLKSYVTKNLILTQASLIFRVLIECLLRTILYR